MILRLLARRRSLLLLLFAVLFAGAVGGLQTLVYRYVHQLDCEAASARNHPRCEPRVTLLLNGRISTMADPPQVEALAVRGGEIVALGSSESLKGQFPDAVKIDLNGYRAFPGFQDLRVALLDGGVSIARLDLGSASDLHRCRELIESFIEGHPEDPWILGQGWSVAALGGQSLTRQTLDGLRTDRPIFLWRDDRRFAALNSRALELLGLTDKSPDPPGGRIDRDRAKRLTGLLEGAAAHEAWDRLIDDLPSRFVKEALLAAQSHLLARGITRAGSVQRRGLESLVALGELYEAGLWRLRVQVHPLLEADSRGAFRLYESLEPESLTIAGPAMAIDGPLAERRGVLSTPFPDGSPALEPRMTADGLGSRLRRVAESRALLVAHGDKALDTALQALETVPEIDNPAVFSVIWPDAAIARATRRGAVAVIAPLLSARWPSLRGELPEGLAPSSVRFRALLDAGLPVVIGSGWPELPADPLLHIQAAVANQDAEGLPVMPAWHDSELVSVEQAIAAYTRLAARAAGRDDREGTLEVGNLADLVVMDRDLLSRSPLEFDTTQVVMTIIGGEVVWRREGGLQFRTDETPLRSSPLWFTVLARQHFLPIVLALAILSWPLVTILFWMWQFRPRPQPPKVLVAREELPRLR